MTYKHRIDEAVIDQIIAKLARGVRQEQIARETGVSQGRISEIKRQYWPKPKREYCAHSILDLDCIPCLELRIFRLKGRKW